MCIFAPLFELTTIMIEFGKFSYFCQLRAGAVQPFDTDAQPADGEPAGCVQGGRRFHGGSHRRASGLSQGTERAGRCAHVSRLRQADDQARGKEGHQLRQGVLELQWISGV